MCEIRKALEHAPQDVRDAVNALDQRYGSTDIRSNFGRACDETYGSGSRDCAFGDINLILAHNLAAVPEYVKFVLKST